MRVLSKGGERCPDKVWVVDKKERVCCTVKWCHSSQRCCDVSAPTRKYIHSSSVTESFPGKECMAIAWTAVASFAVATMGSSDVLTNWSLASSGVWHASIGRWWPIVTGQSQLSMQKVQKCLASEMWQSLTINQSKVATVFATVQYVFNYPSAKWNTSTTGRNEQTSIKWALERLSTTAKTGQTWW